MKPSTFNLQSFGSKDLVQTPADSKVNAKAVITLAGRRMRCIQCLKISCGVSVSGSATAFSFMGPQNRIREQQSRYRYEWCRPAQQQPPSNRVLRQHA
jgi:hypothetical protein